MRDVIVPRRNRRNRHRHRGLVIVDNVAAGANGGVVVKIEIEAVEGLNRARKGQIGVVQSYGLWKGERLRIEKDLGAKKAFTCSGFQHKCERKGDCE